jgi:transcription initiation factor TFIID subunit TAF12
MVVDLEKEKNELKMTEQTLAEKESEMLRLVKEAQIKNMQFDNSIRKKELAIQLLQKRPQTILISRDQNDF